MALQWFCLLRKFLSLGSILYLILTPERETLWHGAVHGVGSQPSFRLGSKRKEGGLPQGRHSSSLWRPDLARSKKALGVPEMTRPWWKSRPDSGSALHQARCRQRALAQRVCTVDCPRPEQGSEISRCCQKSTAFRESKVLGSVSDICQM